MGDNTSGDSENSSLGSVSSSLAAFNSEKGQWKTPLHLDEPLMRQRFRRQNEYALRALTQQLLTHNETSFDRFT
jgi:hypothetical protein